MSIRAKSGKVMRVLIAKPNIGAFVPEAYQEVTEVAKSWPVYGEATYSDCGEYRYGLLRRWDTTLPVMVFIMLNPSTASHEEDDPTIVRCMDFAMRHDCGGILVVNLFAYRTPKPEILWEAATTKNIFGIENMEVLGRVLWAARQRNWPICAGWGAAKNVNVLHAIETLLTLRKEAGATLQCLGYTKLGMPRHPLYLSSTEFLRPWPPKWAHKQKGMLLQYAEYAEEGYGILHLETGLEE